MGTSPAATFQKKRLSSHRPTGAMGEGWTPTTLNLTGSDAGQASSLLLSHASFRSANTSDAAYVLSLFGECAAAAQLHLLTATQLVLKVCERSLLSPLSSLTRTLALASAVCTPLPCRGDARRGLLARGAAGDSLT